MGSIATPGTKGQRGKGTKKKQSLPLLKVLSNVY